MTSIILNEAEHSNRSPNFSGSDVSSKSNKAEAATDPTVKTPQPEVEKSSAPQIPNGGLVAWLQVVASFCMYFSTWLVFFLSSLTHYQSVADVH